MVLTEFENIVVLIGEALVARDATLTTVESCTGGGIACALTALAGSSAWFERGFVTYSNEAKTELAGVPSALIAECGAVSIEVAAAMANGGLKAAHSEFALSVTGIAGPDGGSLEKPVGTVCFGWASRNTEAETERIVFSGNRHEVRFKTIEHALQGMLNRILDRH
jgi:nicotinamide-nucleotide amidase